MIPMRYEGAVHAAGLMWREEGFRGLYRGYTAFIIATSVYWLIVPMAAEIMLERNPISGNIRDKSTELIDDVETLDRIKNSTSSG